MAETITIPRADYEALLERLEDLEDAMIIAERRDDPTIAFGTVERLIAGENPVTVWREERGLKQRELAEASGVSPSMLNEIERGKRTPSLSTARAIARVLNVTLDDLFSDAD